MAANMLASYYGREVDSRSQFEHLRIREDASFERHLNQYHVIFLNMQEFLSTTHDIEKMILRIEKNLLKDKSYVTLAYMTGMLPIKKYGTHSALNMFDEFSMTNPKQLAEFVGFTETEVRELCTRYEMDFEETRRWYDGYRSASKVSV